MSDCRTRMQDILAGRIPDRVPYFELSISEAVIQQMHPGFTHFDFCEKEDIELVFTRWCFHPLEPQSMDIRAVHAQYRDRVVICGTVDCSPTLTFGTPAEVRQEVLGLLADLAPGGRYIMTSSNTIHSQVRPDTYRAMLDTLRERGRYPIGARRPAAGGVAWT